MFKLLGNTDQKTKDTVNGWIGQEEELLQLNAIPSMVKAICILYYRQPPFKCRYRYFGCCDQAFEEKSRYLMLLYVLVFQHIVKYLPYRLLEHLRTHERSGKIMCDICHKDYTTYNYQVHRRIHFPAKYQCPYCPRKFYTRSGLNSHVQHRHPLTWYFSNR